MWNDLFQQSGAVLSLRSPEDVVRVFRSIADGTYLRLLAELAEARHRFLTEWASGADGQAAERVADLACAMAGV
jgi:hypothetical protein